MRRGGRARVAVLVALVGLLVVGVGAPPPVAARGTGDRVPVAAPAAGRADPPVMNVRVLLYDLVNLADPEQLEVDFYNLIFYIERTGPIPKLIESIQTARRGRGAVVDDLFGAVLRRDADPASRDFFIDRLARTGRQKVMADLLASDEYLNRQADFRYPAWIDALYRDALGRPADAAGRQYFLDQLEAGRTRGSVASFFTGGTEGRRALARRLLVELLRRPADAAGVGYFAGRLAAGTSVERVIAMITSSAEYATRSRAEPAPEVDAALLLPGNQLRYQPVGGDGLGFDPPRVVAVSGLPGGDELVALDVRPATGTLVGVTDGGQVVTITPGGDATSVGTPLAGFDAAGGAGLDVHPELDVAEVVAGSTSWRVDLGTGTATTTPVAYPEGDRHQLATPDLVAGTYVAGTRYAIDAGTDALVTRAPAGTLATVGPLHTDVTAVAGLDTSPDAPHRAYAVLDLAEAGPSLWRIDLATGEPRLLDELFDLEVLDLAVIGSPAVAGDDAAYGITPGATPQLRRFSTEDPDPTESWAVVGITPGTEVVGLDVRPATGGLYGIGSNGQVYALAFGPAPATVTASALGAPLPGIDPADGVGFDVDPARDSIRVVDGHRSRRVRVADGVVEHDEDVVFHLAPGVPAIAGSAFTGSERDAPAPPWDPEQVGQRNLFHIDAADGGRLTWEQPMYEDEVSDLGPLLPDGGSIDGVVGFDISGSLRHTAYALLDVDGVQTLVHVDLETGEGRPLADLTGTPQRVYSAFALA